MSRDVSATPFTAFNERRVLLVPVGSIEQHGPHLPLGMDGAVAVAVASRVARLADVDVAPLLPFSASGEHEGFAGLLSLGTDVTAQVATELIRSARATWRGVVFVSGHGGNADALERARQLAVHEGDAVAVWVPRDHEGDPHAGRSETSVALALAMPVGPLPEVEPLPSDWLERARRGGVKAVSTSGVLGDPAGASLHEGERLLDRWSREVVALVHELEDRQ